MNKIIFLCLCITFNLYSQDISSLEKEYMELLEDIREYGPNPTIPYYTNSEQYHYNRDRYLVDMHGDRYIDIDEDCVFAVIGYGFLRFEDKKGNIRYSRFLWLFKDTDDGYFYGRFGKCIDEFIETDREGYYEVTTYLPLPGTKVKRGHLYLEMDEVISVEERTYVLSRKQNTTMIDLVYTVNRMLEIVYTLKSMQTGISYNYDFKIKILEKVLDLVIEERFEVDKEYDKRIENNQPLPTRHEFYALHPRWQFIVDEMLPFLKLKK